MKDIEQKYKDLREIALEILDLYKDAEEGVISEFSVDFEKSRANLKKTVEDYRRKIIKGVEK